MNERGEVILSEHRDPATGRRTVRIDRADPQASIDGGLMRRIAADECEPWVTVANERPNLCITLADDYGNRFIYRIGNYDAATDTYEMEWPD